MQRTLFGKMLTKEEWDNPELMWFCNADIPAEDIELGSKLDYIITEEALPDIPESHIAD